MNFLKISCFSIAFVLVSCIPLDVKNEQHFSDVISIVVADKEIKNSISNFSLDSKPEGVCGRATYTVNFDNQPANVPPFQARLISWNEIKLSTFRYTSDIETSYKDPLLSIASVLNLDHFMFITTTQRAFRDDKYIYELVCRTDSVNNTNMFLHTKLYEQGTDTISVIGRSLIAFDIRAFLSNQIAQGNDSIIQFNLQYATRTDSIGKLVYSAYNRNPIKITVKKQ